MNWTQIGKSACPVAQSLAMVGDRWTLLILRELFIGVPRFEDIQAQTGISSHLLSARLLRLQADGILRRRPYSKRPVRYEYFLTPKGLDLYPVMLALKAWGEKWGRLKWTAERATKVVHVRCGHETGLELACSACHEPFGPRDVRTAFGAKFTAERSRRRAAFLSRRRLSSQVTS
jgi:DNA-binding HxlR family transcriptional regulator